MSESNTAGDSAGTTAPAESSPAPADRTGSTDRSGSTGPTSGGRRAPAPEPATSTGGATPSSDAAPSGGGTGSSTGGARRRRGSRGGRNRNRSSSGGSGGESSESSGSGGSGSASSGSGSRGSASSGSGGGDADSSKAPSAERRSSGTARPSADRDDADDRQPELPDRISENRPSAEAAEKALVRKPRIGDTRPAPPAPEPPAEAEGGGAAGKKKRRRGGRGRGGQGQGDKPRAGAEAGSGGDRSRDGQKGQKGQQAKGGGRSGGKGGGRGGRQKSAKPVEALTPGEAVDLDEAELERRRGRERKGRPVGRYTMAVHVRPGATQIAVLEGRSLIEHYVSRPADDVSQIHGNIYLGKVQNVLPGMEAAFVDIGTPKNAVLYRGDTRYDPEDIEEKGEPRIEQILKARQTIVCQVTKNPIAHKGARLTQEVSLPGRFVVLIPDSKTYGISKRLPDDERKRLRNILDKVKPADHGIIVRTAAEGVSAEEIRNDVLRLAQQWEQISALAAQESKKKGAALLYREPDMAVRVIREEFNKDYRKVVIDDRELYEQVAEYVAAISPALADRVEYYDTDTEPLPLYERHHVHEQLHRALDRKVWLPSGGSLIIEGTEALTVIDVNTGKNVGTSSLEETVYRNNLEAAEEIARQLRLRDIGGIIVIDFIDMEVKANREDVIRTFRDALARDKTRTQVFDISELGLVEMTRKRIGEGLLESFTSRCPECDGRGVVFDQDILPG